MLTIQERRPVGIVPPSLVDEPVFRPAGIFLRLAGAGGRNERGYDNGRKKGFCYKPQYAVIVVCSDEKEQESIYNRLKEDGYRLKVVSV